MGVVEGGEFVVSEPVVVGVRVMGVGVGVDMGCQCVRRSSSVGICGRHLEKGHRVGGGMTMFKHLLLKNVRWFDGGSLPEAETSCSPPREQLLGL